MTSGLDFKDVDSILAEAEKIGFDELSYDDFKANGDKMVLSEEKAREYWEKYKEYNMS